MSEKIERTPRKKIDKLRALTMLSVWRNARPGMKVRCIYDLSSFPGIAGPHEGDVYTIRELRRGLHRTWAVGFTLVEIVNAIDRDQGSEPFFSADNFEILNCG